MVRVVGINANRAALVRTAGLGAGARYQLPVPAGLYILDAEGVLATRTSTHAIRLKQRQVRAVNLPPGTSSANALTTVMPQPAEAAADSPPVATVGPITAHGVQQIKEGADLWMMFDLATGSDPNCDIPYTSDRVLELVRAELAFQRTHFVDPSTRITPHLVKPTMRITGSVTQSGGQITITLKQIDIATHKVVQSQTSTGPPEKFFDQVDAAAKSFGQKLCQSDLKVVSGGVPTTYAFRTSGQEVRFTDKTANVGQASAGGSHTALRIAGAGHSVELARAVPPLEPGQSNAAGSKVTADFSGWDYRTYSEAICADADNEVTEGNETNNCRNTALTFLVLPRSFSGTVSGTVSRQDLADGLTETFSGNVTYGFTAPVGDGAYYEPTSGSISSTLSGTDDFGCSWSGSGTAGPELIDHEGDANTLVIQVGSDPGYYGNAGVDTTYEYNVHVTCPNPEDSFDTTVHPAGFFPYTTSLVPIPLSLPFTELNGSLSPGGGTWNWDLAAGNA
jgi:hypothetical protein